jgi:cytochrome P450
MDTLFDAAFAASPHEPLAQLRHGGPAHRVTLPGGLDVVLVTRHAEVKEALSDGRLSGAAPAEAFDGGALAPDIRAAIFSHMLRTDPPDHTRLRRLITPAFNPRRVEALRPRIQLIADELLDRIEAEETTDLIARYAFPLPMGVICELLGVPSEDQDSFREWSGAFISGLGAAVFPAGLVTDFAKYVQELIAEKRRHPGDDLVSAMIQVRDGDDRLSEDELTSMVFLLIIAGHETTVNLIGNSVNILLRQPEFAAALRAAPDRMASFLEESLRFESPVPAASMRFATESFEFGGFQLNAGDIVLVSLTSANRDEKAFASPDTFQPGEGATGHLAFGYGVHYCIGAPLARMEAGIAIGSLLKRFPDLRLADNAEPVWRPGLYMRGLLNLPVHLR